MSIMDYNGGIVIAMTGKNCVAIAADRRLGVRGQTVGMDFQKVFQMGPKLFIGLPGLATDTITVAQKLKFQLNMYELREGRKMSPRTFSSVVSNLLYERRFGPFFVGPVIAGLDSNNQPYICDMDLIGNPNETKDFAVNGTCSEQTQGMCETLWEPDLKVFDPIFMCAESFWFYTSLLEPDALFEKISQALVNAFDRDAISGWGGIVHIIEPTQITTKLLKTRMD